MLARPSGGRMKTIGEFIAERRKALGLSQKKMAALIKNRDGKPLSMPYLSYLEKWPRRAARVPARSVCQGTACRTRGVVFLDLAGRLEQAGQQQALSIVLEVLEMEAEAREQRKISRLRRFNGSRPASSRSGRPRCPFAG